MKNLMKLLTIGVLVGVVVGACGCTNPLVSPHNQAVDFANTLLSNAKADPGKNSQIISSNVVANGTDGARLSVTISNDTKDNSSIWRNGTTEVIAFSIKKYTSTADATDAFNQVTFGYTQNDSALNNPALTTNTVDVYKTVMGHTATTKHMATKIDVFNFISAEVSLAIQTDEFVTWGTVSVTGK
jgi:hypothetical protein